MQTISLSKSEKKVNLKTDAWEKLGMKYKADKLMVYDKGEYFPNATEVVVKYGYHLRWTVEEDDIHVFGDGKGDRTHTHIKVDRTTYLPKSYAILELALNCLKEIEANRKKYYHI